MKKYSPAEPVTDLRKVPIVECGEELINFMEFCPDLVFDQPRFDYRREQMVRRSVAEKLAQASQNLPQGYRLAIIEGWRAPFIQERMYRSFDERYRKLHPDWSEVRLRRIVNKYSAPMDKKAPPPHTTGGAVDLMLALEDGSLCDHISPYPYRHPKSFAFDTDGLSEEAKRTRTILREALLPTGMTNYPSEFWHWTYGDQGWAYRGGHPHAIYGPVAPPGWEPDPKDLKDEPLVWVHQEPSPNP
jgi:zinc D-Ala-D-Ala dipeptidase